MIEQEFTCFFTKYEDNMSIRMGANLDERSLTWHYYSWWEIGGG
jgi:hypothetical protein